MQTEVPPADHAAWWYVVQDGRLIDGPYTTRDRAASEAASLAKERPHRRYSVLSSTNRYFGSAK